jgi:hypothetical protein
MDVHAPIAGWFAKQDLSPHALVWRQARDGVIAADAAPPYPPGFLQCPGDAIEVSAMLDRHLDIDDVLRGEPGHGGGPDMVYPIGALTESHPK